MITLPGNFFRDAQRAELELATLEGACWVNGDIWLLAGSPLNPVPRRHALLVSCYDDGHPQSPPAEAVGSILEGLAKVVPHADRDTFAWRAAILRAAARAHFES